MNSTSVSPREAPRQNDLAAAIVIPMVVFNVEGFAGLVQRVMFLIGYLCYGAEAWRWARGSS